MATIPLTLLQGTLDLLVLRCLSAGPQHGYAIATIVREQTVATFPSKTRPSTRRCTACSGRTSSMPNGASENNRRARFYTLTPAGPKRLREETANWRRYVRAVDAVLQGACEIRRTGRDRDRNRSGICAAAR